jgi:hypothetical protein
VNQLTCMHTYYGRIINQRNAQFTVLKIVFENPNFVGNSTENPSF